MVSPAYESGDPFNRPQMLEEDFFRLHVLAIPVTLLRLRDRCPAPLLTWVDASV
jgi:hypothetical protein